MSATALSRAPPTSTSTSVSTKPAIPKKSGQRVRNAAGRRAVIVNGSLQVGDLKTSPSWSPAYLLAALEWAEDGENLKCDNSRTKTSTDVDSNKPKHTSRANRKPFVAPQPLAQNKTASNKLDARPKPPIDDVKKPPLPPLARRTAAGPVAPRLDVLDSFPAAEKLVFPFRRTPASSLSVPSALPLETAVRPVFLSPSSSPLPLPSPISPGSGLQHRDRSAHPLRHQRSHDPGPRRRWYEQEEAALSVDRVAQPAVQTDRIFKPASSKFGEDKSAESKQAGMYQSTRSPGAMPSSPAISSPPQSPLRERFAFFSRSRKKSVTADSPRSTLTKRPPISLPISASSSTGTGTYGSRSMPSISAVTESKMPRKLSEPQDPSIRTVSVRCRGNTVILQVDKQTTVDDFLQSCAQEMEKAGRPINPNTSVVIEPCLRPGLERRLRRYELVWDVLNTWEPDSFNTLIVSPDSSDPDGELILATVPDTLEEPDGFILPLYVFQRPGKWSVRYVTLKSNGQIYASKKKDSKPGDKDMVRLCHLSDFDLYMPTEAEMRKQLRPPKRYCYAVRSQERASLFVDNNHYVQYVCTEDPNVARVFRAGVQGWRSWYLVNKKLRLYDPEEVVSPTNLSAAAGFRGRPSIDHGPRGRASMDHGSRGRASTDHGSRSRPSIDLGGSSRSLLASLEDNTDLSGKSAVPPVPPLPTGLVENNPAVFASGGLLGNGYDERRQQTTRKENVIIQQRGRAMSMKGDGPFVDGPNLLNTRAAAPPVPDSRPQTSSSDEHTRSAAPEGGWFPLCGPTLGRTTQRRPLSRRLSTASRAPTRAPSTRQRERSRSRSHSRPLLSQQQQQPSPSTTTTTTPPHLQPNSLTKSTKHTTKAATTINPPSNPNPAPAQPHNNSHPNPS